MRPSDELDLLLRRARYEAFEERLAFSAQPLGDFRLEQMDHRVVPHYGDVAPLASSGNSVTPLDQTGVNEIRNSYGLRGQGQTVAVIDSGIAWDHVALGGGFGAGHRVVGGWDFTEENDANPYDDGPAGFHGTHIAGIIGSTDAKYTGVAPGVDLVGLRVFNDQGAGYFSWVENALSWVHQHRNDFENPITTVNLSLGSNWNSTTAIPTWANLEDEFAQLKADGIFVAVSAGNSFTTYQTAGLSYPAASPSVVPVASVDANGSLSSFSQRSSRVLAAPGRAITSTVPDHVYGADGVKNDFGAASGTSMAAPYVAGASVLVREAMQLAGHQNVTADTIYNQLYNTSDIIFDSATNASYHRINVRAAIDSLMPADDFGSTATTARSLGVVSGTSEIAGLIGRLDDKDFFTFTAGESGTATLSGSSAGRLQLNTQLVGGGALANGNANKDLSFQVVAGQTYTLSLGTTDGIGRYDLDLSIKGSLTNWGAVESRSIEHQKIGAGDRWYQVSASRAGTLTAEAMFQNAAGNVDLEIYDANRNLLAASNSAADRERVDVATSAGQTFLIHVRAATGNNDVGFRLTNLVSRSGSQVDVFGTSGNDALSFTAGATHQVTVNGVDYSFSTADVTTLAFHGQNGQDAILLTGSSANETATLRVGAAELKSSTFVVKADTIESIRIDAGTGTDAANFYDSAGNDRFTGRAADATLEGSGYSNTAVAFDRVTAYARAGGSDSAVLIGTDGNDRFTSRPEYASLSGSGYSNQVSGFQQVEASALGGTDDRAYFYDSTRDDRFEAGPDKARLSGGGYTHDARTFDKVYAYASAGGFDTALLNDSTGDDRLVARPDSSTLQGTGFYLYVSRFEAVTATSSGGADSASLYDSAGDDLFTRSGSSSRLSGAGFSNTAVGFQRVQATAAQGADRAVFEEIGREDAFFGQQGQGRFTRGAASAVVQGFDLVTLRARAGQVAHAELRAVDYVLEKLGDWA